MNEKHHASIAKHRENLNAYEALFNAIVVPDAFDYYSFQRILRLDLQWHSDHASLLLEAGKAFGQEGWTAVGKGDHYDWTKIVMGIEVKIEHAQKLPELETRPVMLKDWPIQLEDTKGVA